MLRTSTKKIVGRLFRAVLHLFMFGSNKLQVGSSSLSRSLDKQVLFIITAYNADNVVLLINPSIAVNLTAFIFGIVIGFTGPNLELFKSEFSPLSSGKITTEEESWVF